MRIKCEERERILPDDVEWVTEWLLSTHFAWVPIGEESPVAAALEPDRSGRTWSVVVRLGYDFVRIPLPLADLARVVAWCYHALSYADLSRPPAPVRGSLLSLRKAMRRALEPQDPLAAMGYSEGDRGECGV